MTLSTRRQATFLVLVVLAAGVGLAVGHFRRTQPEIAARLESFDHSPPVLAMRASAPPPGVAARPTSDSAEVEGAGSTRAGGRRPPRSERERPPSRARAGAGPRAEQNAAEPVDLNRATAEELGRLPGIGPVLAEQIVATRESRGPFGSVDDLRWVKGVGPVKLERVRAMLMVSP